jgi:uncharacterized protein involved in outer membrane biogenesis
MMKLPSWRKFAAIAVLGLALLILALFVSVRMLLGGDRMKLAIEAQAAAAIGRPVAIRAATPHVFPRVGLDLTGISIGAAKEVSIEQATLTTGFWALLQRRVENAEISIVRSQIDLRWALDLLAAFSGSASPTPASGSAFTIDSIGTLALRDVTLVAGTRTLRVDLESSLAGGDRLVITDLRGRGDGSELRATGELTSIERRTGTLSIDADTLDLDGLLAFLAAATPAGAAQLNPPTAGTTAPSALVPLHVDIDIKARRGRVLGIALTSMSAACRMRGGDVLLENLTMDLFDGRYAGAAAFRSSRGQPRYEWRGTFEHLDVPQLMAFAGATGAMTGRLAGTMELSAVGADPQVAMLHATGTTRVAITDGRIPGLEIVRSVILAFGKPTGERPGGSGEAFSRIAATLAVAAPVLSTRDLSFTSRDLDLTGEGTLSLASRSIDLRADVILSRELSAQAGRDLYRLAREGERIVLPARITGTATSPTVFVDVQAALSRALRNQAQDRIKSLFDRWRKGPK